MRWAKYSHENGRNTGIIGSIFLSNREEKLTIMKSLRMTEGLMRTIADECKSRNMAFSDYMREAAIAAMKQHFASCDGMSGAGGRRRKNLEREFRD